VKIFLDDVNKSIDSALELIKFLDWINEECALDIGKKEGVQEDIESIKYIIRLLRQIQSKEDIREVWSIFQNISHEFGGYAGDRIGRKLNKAHNRLWENLLNALANAQEVNKPTH
jgi:hypothetical protein